MGHVLFLLIHFVLLLFFWIGLVVTIPLHLIYAAVSGGKRDPREGSLSKYVSCPYCKEAVHQEASVCPKCRGKLMPLSEQRAAYRAEHPGFWGWLNKPR